jgi:hypothetical protein
MFEFGQLLFEFQLGQTDILTSLNKPSISNEVNVEVKQQLCALVHG